MATEFVFEGESFTLASEDEFRAAVMRGRLVSRKNGISKYHYEGRDFILSKTDLQAIKAASIT